MPVCMPASCRPGFICLYLYLSSSRLPSCLSLCSFQPYRMSLSFRFYLTRRSCPVLAPLSAAPSCTVCTVPLIVTLRSSNNPVAIPLPCSLLFASRLPAQVVPILSDPLRRLSTHLSRASRPAATKTLCQDGSAAEAAWHTLRLTWHTAAYPLHCPHKTFPEGC